MQIRIRPAYEKPQGSWSPASRVIIDVFRAATTALAILENGASEFIVANDYDLLNNLADSGFLVISEVFDLGLDNSPTLVRALDIRERQIALKTSNLTTALEENDFSGEIYICCFNNLTAVANFIRARRQGHVEIIPAGLMASQKMNFEDIHCAEALRDSLVSGQAPALNYELLRKRIAEKCDGQVRERHYIDDLNLAIKLDISDVVPTVVNKGSGKFWLAKG